jgi:hypothetical protein
MQLEKLGFHHGNNMLGKPLPRLMEGRCKKTVFVPVTCVISLTCGCWGIGTCSPTANKVDRLLELLDGGLSIWVVCLFGDSCTCSRLGEFSFCHTKHLLACFYVCDFVNSNSTLSTDFHFVFVIWPWIPALVGEFNFATSKFLCMWNFLVLIFLGVNLVVHDMIFCSNC